MIFYLIREGARFLNADVADYHGISQHIPRVQRYIYGSERLVISGTPE
ncbi:MAG: hypothetical protein H6561_22475 [Lewinellaceae bacterium]|nr:hypothetical protein [Lewinellaceae bacterium]